MNKFEKALYVFTLVLFVISMVAMYIVVPEFYTALFTWPFNGEETISIALWAIVMVVLWRKLPKSARSA